MSSNGIDKKDSVDGVDPELHKTMGPEENRLKSFSKDWPHTRLSPEKLARSGFYHTPTPQHPDRCICFICESALYNWDPDDDPWEEHCKWYPNCPFVMGKPTKNVPLERDEGDAGSGSGGDWGNGDTGSDTKLGYRAKAEEGSGSGFMSFKRGGLNSYVEQLTRKSSKQLEKNDSGLEKMSASEQPAMEMKDMNATDGALAEQDEEEYQMQKEALLAKITKSMESRQGSGSQEIEPISDRRSAKKTRKKASISKDKKQDELGPLEDDDVRKRRTDAEREIKELSTQANNLSMELRATELSISSSSQLFSRLRDKALSEADKRLTKLTGQMDRINANIIQISNVWLVAKKHELDVLLREVGEAEAKKAELSKSLAEMGERSEQEKRDLELLRRKDDIMREHAALISAKQRQIQELEETKELIDQEVNTLTEEKAMVQNELVDIKDSMERRKQELEGCERKLQTWGEREAAITAMEAELAARERAAELGEQDMRAREEWMAKKEGEMRCLESVLLTREKKVKEREMTIARKRSELAELAHNRRLTPHEQLQLMNTGADGKAEEGADCNLPLWIPDDAVLDCMLCQTRFTLVRRRHHCRICGRVCCNPCSDGKYQQLTKIKRFGFDQPVRVCMQCRGYLDAGDS